MMEEFIYKFKIKLTEMNFGNGVQITAIDKLSNDLDDCFTVAFMIDNENDLTEVIQIALNHLMNFLVQNGKVKGIDLIKEWEKKHAKSKQTESYMERHAQCNTA